MKNLLCLLLGIAWIYGNLHILVVWTRQTKIINNSIPFTIYTLIRGGGQVKHARGIRRLLLLCIFAGDVVPLVTYLWVHS